MTCACHGNGMGAATPVRFKAIEQILAGYINDCVMAGDYFYISPQLNSNTVTPAMLRQNGLGDDIDYYDDSGNLISDSYATGSDITAGSGNEGLFSSIIGAATSIGNAVLTALPSIAKIKGLQAQANAANTVNSVLGRTGVQIPGAIAGQTIGAAQKDILGVSPTVLLLAGGALLLFMAMR